MQLAKRSKLRCAVLFAAIVFMSAPVVAQEGTVTPNQGFAQSQCGWDMYKPYPGTWGWLYVEFRGGSPSRQLGTSNWQGYDENSTVTIVLDTTYLPSQSLQCTVTNAGVEQGIVFYPEGNSYEVSHENSTCDGYAQLVRAADPNHSYWVSEELDNMNAMIGAAALDSGAYWTAVGSELQYPGLATQYCCESGFYPHPEPQPGIAAQWDPISNQIWMNVHHDFGFTQAQWAWLGAHELGHAIGFGHSASTDYSRTIMMHGAMVGGIPGTGLNPRPFEKCSAVQSFSVNIQIGG